MYARPTLTGLDVYALGIALNTVRANADALAADLDANREPVSHCQLGDPHFIEQNVDASGET